MTVTVGVKDSEGNALVLWQAATLAKFGKLWTRVACTVSISIPNLLNTRLTR
jgi:hypothetical protein